MPVTVPMVDPVHHVVVVPVPVTHLVAESIF